MDTKESEDYKDFQKYVESYIDEILLKNIKYDVENLDVNNAVNELMKCDDIHQLTKKLIDSYETQNYVVNLEKSDVCSNFDLDHIINNLIHNKETASKVKTLQLVFSFPLTELTDENYWPRLSKILRDYLICKNKQLFESSFKIHQKLISYPDTIFDGFANVIKTLLILFNSKKGYLICEDGFTAKNYIQQNTLLIVNLLLSAVKMLNSVYNNRDKTTENFINDFMDLICVNTFYDKSENLNIINYIALLDPKANWFYDLTYNLSSRNIVFGFCKKNPTFFRYLITKLTNTSILNYSTDTKTQARKLCGNDVTSNIVNLASLYHCGNIVGHMFQFKQTLEFFPVSVKSYERPITNYNLVIIIITTINKLEFVPNQKHKRKLLICFLKQILVHNYHYLTNKEVVYVLIKPLYFISMQNYLPNVIVAENIHIYEICSRIDTWKDGFLILFGLFPNVFLKTRSKIPNVKFNRSVSLGYHYPISYFIEKYLKSQGYTQSAKEKDTVVLGKVVIEFTIALFRSYVNSIDLLDTNEVFNTVLHCCYNIFAAHSHAFFMVNSQKLVAVLRDLYKIIVDDSSKNSNAITKLLALLCANYSSFDSIRNDSDLVYVITKEYLMQVNFYENTNVVKFLNNVSYVRSSHKAIVESAKSVIFPYLNSIWLSYEDEFMFVTGSSRKVDDAVFQLLKFVFQISFNSKCVQALISKETKHDDDTVIENDFASNLQDLILDSLSDSGPGTLPIYVGLQCIRTIITNIDNLVYLENELNLKENLEKTQAESKNINDEINIDIIIDECSLLRNELIHTIKSVSTNNYSSEERTDSINKKICVPRSAVTSSRKKPLNEFQRYLNESRNNLHDNNWLTQLKKCYKYCVKDQLKENVLLDVIQQVKLVYPQSKLNYVWSNSEAKYAELHNEELTAISMVVRYGIHNGLLLPCNANEDNLTTVLKQVKGILDMSKNSYVCFDWFIATIFLICGGNVDRTKNVLKNVSGIPNAPYFWYELGRKLQNEKKHNILSHLDCGFNLLIEDLDTIHRALQVSCISWNALAHSWLKQCFFNSLEWKEICHFLTICILFPPDYILFYFASLAMFLEKTIFKAVSYKEISLYRKLFSLHGFQISEYFSFIENLGKHHKNILSSQ